MILSNNINVYLRTTDTCNLNCQHCFTSGSNGKKIYIDHNKTINFFGRLISDFPHIQHIDISFHGGEPMLLQPSKMRALYEDLKKVIPSVSFGTQTNLVFKLTEERRQLFKDLFYDVGFGTSWDYDIRFGSTASKENKNKIAQQQRELWEHNVRELVKDGHQMTMIVCMTNRLIKEKEPKEIIEYAANLGFKWILFERITLDGNAIDNPEIRPRNQEQDDWLKKMWDQTIEFKLYEKIGNMLLDEISRAFLYREHTANRCRNCQQSLLTITAAGKIYGCPNSTDGPPWGNIDMRPIDVINSRGRSCAVVKEQTRRDECLVCPAFDICNGDCHQLPWEGSKCGAPQEIFKYLMKNQPIEECKKLLMRD